MAEDTVLDDAVVDDPYDANYKFDFLDTYFQQLAQSQNGNTENIKDSTDDGFYDEPDSDLDTPVDENNTDAADENDNFLNEDDAADYSGNDPNYDRSLGNQISGLESGGKYDATNPNSSATGKYQFLWSKWGDDIKRITGVESREQFLHSPAAQEEYYSYYEQNYLTPGVERIKNQVPNDLNDTQLAKLIHFRGEAGAKQYLTGQLSDQPESYNIPISKYIKQAGGIIPSAMTKHQQFVGLNDSSLDQLLLPLSGTNVIRGLDSGQPVMVQDETGVQQILHGPDDTVSLQGKVYEKRLKYQP